MSSIQSDITIAQFALTDVKKLKKSDTLIDAIKLMQNEHIRHIPIVDKTKIVGIINSGCILRYFQHKIKNLSFDVSLSEIMCPTFKSVNKDTSLFEVVREISRIPSIAILVEENGEYIGIYTEQDLLDTDFLWIQFNDFAVGINTKMGRPINEFTCITHENTIFHALHFMANLGQEYIALIDAGSKQLRGVVSFFDIINHLHYTSTKQNRSLLDVISKSVFGIFPSAGLYLQEPVLLSKLRKEMYLSDEYFAIILSSSGIPGRIISSKDIVTYLIQSSDFILTGKITNKK